MPLERDDLGTQALHLALGPMGVLPALARLGAIEATIAYEGANNVFVRLLGEQAQLGFGRGEALTGLMKTLVHLAQLAVAHDCFRSTGARERWCRGLGAARPRATITGVGRSFPSSALRRCGGVISVLAVLLTGCTSPGGSSEPEAAVEELPEAVDIVAGAPLPQQHRSAIEALSASAPVAPFIDDDEAGHGHHGGHGGHGGSAAEVEPSDELKAELDEARAAAVSLMTTERLSDAEYYLGSYWSRGVGTHYINWKLVGQEFDPATPAMLLVDTTPGHRRRLAGFSYWVSSDDGPPEGFAGDADEWHSHRGLCFIEGVLESEQVEDPAACAGAWIDGTGLWMLHAWVVPGFTNPDGLFAPVNPRLCPPRRGPDIAWC